MPNTIMLNSSNSAISTRRLATILQDNVHAESTTSFFFPRPGKEAFHQVEMLSLASCNRAKLRSVAKHNNSSFPFVHSVLAKARLIYYAVSEHQPEIVSEGITDRVELDFSFVSFPATVIIFGSLNVYFI